MFLLRGIAISLAIFCLSYGFLSALVACGWRLVAILRNLQPRTFANLLLGARILPLTLSALITLLFAAPSFVLLEPRGVQEKLGWASPILGACGLALLAAGFIRVILAQVGTRRIASRWLPNGLALDLAAPAPTFGVPGHIPPLTLAGVFRPRLLLAESTLVLLSPNELRVAVQHEVAHLRSRDNLKKVVLRFAWFPGMENLERTWEEAAELAADDAAASSAEEALDLAAAIIKLSRQVPGQRLPAISVGLIRGSVVSARVERLVNWKQRSPRAPWRLHLLLIPFAITLVFAITASYGSLLAQTHVLTEWLVR
jgi:hypothetical protein